MSSREIRAPRGNELTCKAWPQEAALRMLMNNLDPDVAERPEDLVVYGGTGKAARNHEALKAIVATLLRLAEATGAAAEWRVRIRKEIPVAAGLGGGSADAAAALRLANETIPEPLTAERLHEVATGIGADIPFFLEAGPKLAAGAGERLKQLDLPQDYWVLVALPRGARKRATADVYKRFDELGGEQGFEERKQTLAEALAACRRPRHFTEFPANDLAEAAGGTSLAADLLALGAFRADVSGAGPAVYALFHRLGPAKEAAGRVRRAARTWIAAPVW